MVETQHRLDQPALETLRERTSPHFLFNALNSVEALSRRAPERIPELVRGLSGCLRYWLRPAPDGWVTLQQELDAVDSYLHVEQVRFEGQFEVEFEIAEAARLQRVPQFFLQPLVENAIREGLGAGPRPLRVFVTCRRLDNRLQVEVRNAGVESGRATARGSDLEDLQRRLDVLYQDDGYGWTRSESADWVSLMIEIPLETPTEPLHPNLSP
jgi:two-component system LytT family sensor kinase